MPLDGHINAEETQLTVKKWIIRKEVHWKIIPDGRETTAAYRYWKYSTVSPRTPFYT